jgi:hypothetical protein
MILVLSCFCGLLCVSVYPLCLCGENIQAKTHHRDTEPFTETQSKRIRRLAVTYLDFASSRLRITFHGLPGDVAEWLKAAVC